MMLRHAALFNGIGGFQIAAEAIGWDTIFSSEINDFTNIVTADKFCAEQLLNIHDTDFSRLLTYMNFYTTNNSKQGII